MDEPTDDVDAEQAVATYHRVIAQLETETTQSGREEFETIANRLRTSWKTWQGEDSLHEMAFGEPEQ